MPDLTLLSGVWDLAFIVVSFIVALSIIVAVHEYGHYIVGRWSGIRADVFSIGFGPVLASRVDRRGTRWQVAALPFGGFVKFAGDADAASGKDVAAMEALTPEDRRHTMHGAPLWARAATVLAGPVANFILSILVFAALFAWRGTAVEPVTVSDLVPLPDGVAALAPGDVILEVDGLPALDVDALYGDTREREPRRVVPYTVVRDGREMVLDGPWMFPPLAASVAPGSAADEAGLEDGDVVLAVNGTEIFAFSQLQELVRASDGAPVDLEVWRDGRTLDFQMTPIRRDIPKSDGGFETHYMIGVTGGMAFEPALRTPGPLEAIGGGVDQTIFIIRSSLSALWHMVAGKISSCNLSGPIAIAEVSGQAASKGGTTFLWFIAVLSTAVGLLNLFPIPVLDGGHLVFHAWEATTGSPPSDRALRVLMAGGLTLMLMLMVFALTNDIFCP